MQQFYGFANVCVTRGGALARWADLRPSPERRRNGLPPAETARGAAGGAVETAPGGMGSCGFLCGCVQ
ncbi:MAG: hypothetical protein ACI4UC_06150 [Alloprevotella sp.]